MFFKVSSTRDTEEAEQQDEDEDIEVKTFTLVRRAHVSAARSAS
jgi:hypothetical protein